MAFYSDFFAIDDNYFPVIDKSVLQKDNEIWKKYFATDGFKKILETIKKNFNYNQPKSIWVTGPYGTGKSHALLTLEMLLNSPEADVREYFDDNKSVLGDDLCHDFLVARGDNKNVLVCHRYSSSDVRGDNALMNRIEESILTALKEKGIENKATSGLIDQFLDWTKDNANKNYLDQKLKKYEETFDGKNVDEIIDELKESRETDGGSSEVFEKLTQMAEREGMSFMSRTIDKQCEWITEVIKKNNLSAIYFLWDEFEDFLKNNAQSLTGFQQLAQLSISGHVPFYFVCVVHKDGLDLMSSISGKTISDRFVNCEINMPADIAFQLMGKAMKVTSQIDLAGMWNQKKQNMITATTVARQYVLESNNRIKEENLKKILPIHPYAGLVLQSISTLYTSNARSMFEFLKDNEDGYRGFKTFARENDADKRAFLTIDYLWDYLSKSSDRDSSSATVRTILDQYELLKTKKIPENSELDRVFKVTLILYALKVSTGGENKYFKPSTDNIKMAFTGDPTLDETQVQTYLERLKTINLLMSEYDGNEIVWAPNSSIGDTEQVEKVTNQLLDEIRGNLEKHIKPKPSKLIETGHQRKGSSDDIWDSLQKNNNQISSRHRFVRASTDNFKDKAKELENVALENKNLTPVLYGLAINQNEGSVLFDLAKKYFDNPSTENSRIIFVISKRFLDESGDTNLHSYCENMARKQVSSQSRTNQSENFSDNANKILEKWKNDVVIDEFIVYSKEEHSGAVIKINQNDVKKYLTELNRKRHPLSCEVILSEKNINNDTLYQSTQFAAISKMAFENSFTGAWKDFKWVFSDYTGEYWINNDQRPVSKVKRKVDSIVKDCLRQRGNFKPSEIFKELSKDEDISLLKTNATAAVLAFCLKDYIGSKYIFQDYNGRESDLNNDNFSKMIDTGIRGTDDRVGTVQVMKDSHYAFIKCVKNIFSVDESVPWLIGSAVNHSKMKITDFCMPLFCLTYYVDTVDNLLTNKDIVKKAIIKFCGVCNPQNYDGSKTVNMIAAEIGTACMENEKLPDDLKAVIKKDNCKKGLQIFLRTYKNNALPTIAADTGNDSISLVCTQYLNSSGSYLWNEDTLNEIVDSLILDCSIVKLLRQHFGYNNTDLDGSYTSIRETVGRIKIPKEIISEYIPSLKKLLDIFSTINSGASVVKERKKEFLDRLTANGNEMKEFLSDQRPLFKDYFREKFDSTSDDNVINAIFDNLSSRYFERTPLEFENEVRQEISANRVVQLTSQLKDEFEVKTGSSSPKEWSRKNRMPIRCMYTESENRDIRFIESCLTESHSEQEIERALSMFDTDIFDRLSDSSKKRESFMNTFVGESDVLFTDDEDIEKLKDAMISAMREPYFWSRDNSDLMRTVKKFIDNKYKNDGFRLVSQKINKMTPEVAKKYLCELVENNAVVGTLILRDEQ